MFRKPSFYASVLSIIILAGAACTAVDTDTSDASRDEISWRILDSGSTRDADGSDDAPRILVARSHDEYRELWRRHISSQEPPPVAFDEESVIFLLGGKRPTGGFAVDPREVDLEAQQLLIRARVQGPGPGEMVSQVLTYPWSAVAVNRRSFSRASWYSEGALIDDARVEESAAAQRQ